MTAATPAHADASCLVRALFHREVEYTPVWIMRQAGRYLPEYRRLRERAGSFSGMYKEPDYACEATLQPLERYPLDAAILFSDILTVPEAMGMELEFIEGRGPVFAQPLSCRAEVRALREPEPREALDFVMAAAAMVRRELAGRKPLIGFAGTPWTLACYMLQGGGGATDFQRPRALLYAQPEVLHELLERLARAVSAYLCAQAEAGAEVLMLFDSCAGWLDRRCYREFALRYLTVIAAQLAPLRDRIPVIYYARGAGGLEADIAACGVDAVGVDWTRELCTVRRLLQGRAALQGNLDPCALFGTDADIRTAVARVLADYGAGSGHVFNLGHGIHKDTDPGKLAVLIDAVHELSRPYHA